MFRGESDWTVARPWAVSDRRSRHRPLRPSPLPVLGTYDVVVVGGGTSGAPAGIASAKSGARTLVIEYLYELGGVGTVGLIASYWYGRRRGFTEYVDQQVNPGKPSWNAVDKAEWLRRELTRSGADVWLGALGCGVLTARRQVRGVVVATPQGRGVVLAATVVDATGNADIAAWAGAQTQFGLTENGSLNVQIAGFPERPLRILRQYLLHHGRRHRRPGRVAPDGLEADQLPPTSAFDVGQLVDSRERRRVVGDYTLTVPDILSHRTFPDTISQHYSNFDAAAFPDSRLLLVRDAKGPCFHTDLPYRCLLPQGLDGILVVGLGASAERDAMTLIRMQADLQNQGYAAGLAAAAAVKAGRSHATHRPQGPAEGTRPPRRPGRARPHGHGLVPDCLPRKSNGPSRRSAPRTTANSRSAGRRHGPSRAGRCLAENAYEESGPATSNGITRKSSASSAIRRAPRY